MEFPRESDEIARPFVGGSGVEMVVGGEGALADEAV